MNQIGQIDFAFGCRDRLHTACLIARKRCHAGQRLVVYCSNISRLNTFDRMLWAFDETSFIPHVHVDDPLASSTPVVLTAASPKLAQQVMGDGDPPALLNLDDACPPDSEDFAHIMEVVSETPEDRQAARQRWRAYQTQGRELKAYDLARRAA